MDWKKRWWITCFTIREITAILKALSNKDNKLKPYQIIMIIYGEDMIRKEKMN